MSEFFSIFQYHSIASVKKCAFASLLSKSRVCEWPKGDPSEVMSLTLQPPAPADSLLLCLVNNYAGRNNICAAVHDTKHSPCYCVKLNRSYQYHHVKFERSSFHNHSEKDNDKVLPRPATDRRSQEHSSFSRPPWLFSAGQKCLWRYKCNP